jgi:hypothetical protein
MTKFAAVLMAAMMLGTGAVAPVQAQGFGIFFGDEPSDFFGDDRGDGFDERIICLSDSQIRAAVADRGYSDISLNVPNEKHIQVRATKDGWVYLLDFNYCSGRIEDRERLRPAG